MLGDKGYYDKAFRNGANVGYLYDRKTVHPNGLTNYLVYAHSDVKSVRKGSPSLVEGFTVVATYRISGKGGIVVCKKD